MTDKDVLEMVENILKKVVEDLSPLQKSAKDPGVKEILKTIQDNIWNDFLMVVEKQIRKEGNN